MSQVAASVDALPVAAAAKRYTLVAIVLHWLIAALILANIFVGWRMGGLTGFAQFELFQLHKSLGVAVLLLSLARLAWRLANRPPPLPSSLTRLERFAAGALHRLFYAAMILIPLTGWIVVSASPLNIPTLLFRAVPWPHIDFIHELAPTVRRGLETQIGDLHGLLVWSFLVLIAFHAAAALKHHFWDRDGVLSRMLPVLRRTDARVGRANR